MTPDEIRRLIEPEGHALRARGVTALYVFGSTVAGTAHPASDVDIVVEYDRGSNFNLIDLSGVRRQLSARLGVDVDVVTKDGLHRRIKDSVMRQAVRVL
jgi:predicted nucleotidyltransferase